MAHWLPLRRPPALSPLRSLCAKGGVATHTATCARSYSPPLPVLSSSSSALSPSLSLSPSWSPSSPLCQSKVPHGSSLQHMSSAAFPAPNLPSSVVLARGSASFSFSSSPPFHPRPLFSALSSPSATGLRFASTEAGASDHIAKDVVKRLFNDEQSNVVNKAKLLLGRFVAVLGESHADAQDIQLLLDAQKKLDEMFMLVIVGEYNSGKSSFLNALLGNKYLKEGVTPTTDRVHVIKYGAEGSGVPLALQDHDKDVAQLNFPVEWLKDINLVDTPGTNAIIRSHQRITEHFIPSCDMVIFVTSADRAFSESEKKFLQLITKWKKKVIVALSKVDILENEETELREILNFISFNMKEVLGHDPVVFPISSKKALAAKQHASEGAVSGALWKESRFGELERFILETLDEGERSRLKILNPVVAAERMVEKYRKIAAVEQKMLGDDQRTMESIHKQLDRFKEDMEKDFSFQRARLENVLLRLQRRGEEYLDRTLGLSNVFTLMRPATLKEEFELHVIGNSALKVEKHVSELVDWLVEKQSQQWTQVMDAVQRQILTHKNASIPLNTQFEYNRKELLEQLGSGVRDVIGEYDKDIEVKKLQSAVSSALVQTAFFEASALGLGALFATVLMDVTGILGISALAATGLAILPYRKRQMKRDLVSKIDELRVTLNETLDGHFQQELHAGSARIAHALSPYAAYVEEGQGRIDGLGRALDGIERDVQAMRDDIHTAWKE